MCMNLETCIAVGIKVQEGMQKVKCKKLNGMNLDACIAVGMGPRQCEKKCSLSVRDVHGRDQSS